VSKLVRPITATARAEIKTELGTNPFIVIAVDWTNNESYEYYADRDDKNAEGKIISLSGLESALKLQGGGQTFNVTVTLDDTDGTIQERLEVIDIHKVRCKIYQDFVGLAESHRILLFDGELNSPIIWDDSTRQFTFTIVNETEDREVGFSPEQADADFVTPDAIGVAWPLCFGNVVRVPAVKITTTQRGQALTFYGLITRDELSTLQQRVKAYAELAASKNIGDNVFDIENLVVTTGTRDYTETLNAISSAYIDVASTFEGLLKQNTDQEDNIISFMDVIAEITYKERIIERLNDLNNAYSESIEEKGDEVDDIDRAIETEQQKAPYQDDLLVSNLLSQRQAIFNEMAGLNLTQAAIISQRASVTAELGVLETQKNTLINAITEIALEEIIIESVEEFPQGEETDIIVNLARFRGSFQGNVFTVTDNKLPTDVSVDFAMRQNDNPNEFWISSSLNLQGKYCLIATDPNQYNLNIVYRVVYIEQQDGTRCFFNPVVWEKTADVNDRDAYEILYFEGTRSRIVETSPIFLQTWLGHIENDFPDFVTGLGSIGNIDWGINFGDEVISGVKIPEKYICNLVASTEILEVVGARTIDGQRKIVPIPTNYYSKSLSGPALGQTVTSLLFKRPLADYNNENWTGEVFVTLKSTLSSNTATAIEWILDNYTDYDVDSSSFSSVETAIENYPSHFALLERRNALALVEDMAFQARCAIWITDKTAYIKYLSEEPDDDFTIDETEIDFNTIQLTMTPTEELITKFVGEWIRDYTQEAPFEVVLRNNVPRYGKIERRHNFFIYNIESLVIKSVHFWLIRLSNTWKLLKFKTFLTMLEAEIFDCLELDLVGNPFGRSPGGKLKTVVRDITYDTENHRLEFTVWTPIRTGEMTPYKFAWPASAPANLTYPTSNDPYAGGG
jgi:hypothetical protein